MFHVKHRGDECDLLAAFGNFVAGGIRSDPNRAVTGAIDTAQTVGAVNDPFPQIKNKHHIVSN